jgi:uncharacterized protein YabE (DUF348 family)
VLRSVKYGLYGAVLAGLVAVPALWNSVDKTVDLVVDGRPHAVNTTARTVAQVLNSQGYRVTSHDLLAPSASTDVQDGTRIVLRRGRLLHLDVDGVRTDVWTTAPTVDQALADLGYSSSDFVSVSRARRLPLGATDIAIRTQRLLTIIHDGKREQVTTTEPTIGAVLADLGIVLGPLDRISSPTTAAVEAGETLRIQRVTRKLVSRLETRPFPVTKRRDPTMLVGTTKIVRTGKTGRTREIYALIYIDGKPAGRTLVRSVVLRDPVAQIERVGTGRPTRTPQVPTLAPQAPAPSPGTAKAIARDLVAKRGWDGTQYDCLVALWNAESGWNVHATNSSTGAYGIPQALPGSKMATAGPDWQNSATTQITWGLGYIAGRYGTPCGAWSYWQSAGWY